MKCGLVILNYNDYTQTEGLLTLIKDCQEIDNIVVVDNASTDDSYSRLKKYDDSYSSSQKHVSYSIPDTKYAAPRISVIQSGLNGGYSFGNNTGARFLIEHFHPDIIGIANPDTIFDGSFVHRIKEVFAANPDYAVLTGIQTNAAGKTGIHAFWENFGTPGVICCSILRDVFIKPFMTLRKKPSRCSIYLHSVQNSPKIPCEVWAVEGSLFFVRTEDFVKAGMFDERVFMYFEEDILAFKLHKLGQKIGVVNDTAFIHKHASPDPDTDRRLDAGIRYVRLSGCSLRYYFCSYVTDSRILHAIFSCLLVLRRAKAESVYFLRKIIHHTKKYLTVSNASR